MSLLLRFDEDEGIAERVNDSGDVEPSVLKVVRLVKHADAGKRLGIGVGVAAPEDDLERSTALRGLEALNRTTCV